MNNFDGKSISMDENYLRIPAKYSRKTTTTNEQLRTFRNFYV
jgi:hypothetical protein